jgi:hypothetical protein
MIVLLLVGQSSIGLDLIIVNPVRAVIRDGTISLAYFSPAASHADDRVKAAIGVERRK